MAPTNPPKGDRAGGDYQRGPNPAAGGDIGTGTQDYVSHPLKLR
jgi:hypothetical protein